MGFKNAFGNILARKKPSSANGLILALHSENKEEVIRAVNTLSREREGGAAEKALCNILKEWRGDESYASLWVMVALGYIGSRNAMPLLLDVLDSDADIWKEAAEEALVHIALKHGDRILDPIEEFIELRLDNDPFNARLYAHGPIAALKTSERAKQFLMRMFAEDEMWRDSLAQDLAEFGDQKLLPLFRRAIEYARQSHDEMAERELREAYCKLDGIRFGYMDRPELHEEPWEQRWAHKLGELGKTDEEIEVEEKERFARFDEKTGDPEFERRIQEENAIRDAHPLRDFSIAGYLAVRKRGAAEEEFDDALRLLGLDRKWTVEKAQLLINAVAKPKEALEKLFDGCDFPSEKSFEEFVRRFERLWNETPREELHGLTPSEMLEMPEARKANDRANREREREWKKLQTAEETALSAKADAGRNDPCPCGATDNNGRPVKYKRCHGK